TGGTLIFIAAVAIGARLYLRLGIQKRRLLSSDILMSLAWVASVVTEAFTIKLAQSNALDPKVKSTFEGFEGSSEELAFVLKMFWVCSIPFFTALYLCKGALLAVYLQVFPKSMRKRRTFLWGTVGFVVISYITSILMVLCVCLPIKSNWSLDSKTACPPKSVGLVFQVGWALHFSGDLLVFAIPWLIVPGLQMKTMMKTGVYCTFLLGLVNITFCLVRFVTIQTSLVNDAVPVSLISLWSTLDCNIGLVIACLPSLRPYL
ncbi:hypothetical protein BGZ61DRAFT_296845, partial [Ilyonectria robusta]|uniref:uncharacterized protein n=1 Tax=Ilyonectria robusta TaxID=1079257 RepID=UPI001E8CC754